MNSRSTEKRAAHLEAAHKERTHCIAAPSPSGREAFKALDVSESIVGLRQARIGTLWNNFVAHRGIAERL